MAGGEPHIKHPVAPHLTAHDTQHLCNTAAVGILWLSNCQVPNPRYVLVLVQADEAWQAAVLLVKHPHHCSMEVMGVGVREVGARISDDLAQGNNTDGLEVGSLGSDILGIDLFFEVIRGDVVGR